MHDQPTPGARPGAPRREATGAYCVMNTLRALERLALGPHSSPELARALGIDARSARRMLQRLTAEGYVVQDPGHRRRYRATLRLVAVGAELLRRTQLPGLAAPVVGALARGGPWTAHLWVSGTTEAFCLVHAEPGATGETPAPRLSPIDAGDHGPAAAVLDPARRWQRSCAYARDERLAGVAAAIVDRGVVVAALGLTGDVDVADLATVVSAAEELSRTLAEAVCAR
jgi:DNA-binding IclR family transcriptional regulator